MRVSNRDMAVLVLILIFFSLANILPMKVKVYGKATDQASATIMVNVVGEAPLIESFYPLTNVTITEEQNQTFNVSFIDADDSSLFVMWFLDDDIVKEEVVDLMPIGVSNYTFIANYSSAGEYFVSVSVSDGGNSASQWWILNVTNVNRIPYFNVTIPDISWSQGSSHTMESLDNYAEDPDLEDSLSYEVMFISEPSQVEIRIDPVSHEVLFRGVKGFVGSEIVYFKVIDNWGAFNYSNNVTLSVTERPAPKPPSSTSSSSGGGGGGRVYDELCENYWYCGGWGKCDPLTNTTERECVDLAACSVGRNKPKEIDDCIYVPTCYDGIKNKDEIGIDCGGDCPSCWSCFDGTKNQGEEGIDCGGPCEPCATCDDGLRNCIRLDKEIVLCEKGVDCGGSCPTDCCQNDYWDVNLGEEDIDCGGDCMSCEMFAPDRMRVYLLYSTIALVSAVALIFGTKLILKRYGKEEIKIIEESLAIKDLGRFYEGLNKLEKVIDTAPIKRVVKLLSYITAKIIYYRYNVDLSCTEEELIKRLSKIEGDGGTRDSLKRIYSRLYYLKFSGDEASREGLLHLIKEIKNINYMTLRKLYVEQKRLKEKMAKKNPFFMGLYRVFGKNEAEQKVIKKMKEDLKYKKKRIDLGVIKNKVIPIAMIVLTLSIMLSLFIIPQKDIAKSGFSIEQSVMEKDGSMETKAISEGGLLTRFVDWLVGRFSTVGRAPGPLAPQFVNLNDGDILEAVEDSNASFLIIANDDGDDDLIFSFAVADIGKKIFGTVSEEIDLNNATSGWINFTPTEDYVHDSNTVENEYTVSILVKDSAGRSDSKYVVFNITNVNDAPDIPDYSPPTSPAPVMKENESLLFWFDNETADPDLIHPGMDSIVYDWFFNGTYNNSNQSWTYYPGFCDNGTYNVTLIVEDKIGEKGNLTWEVTVEDLVRPPRLNKTFVGYEYMRWDEGTGGVSNHLIMDQFFEDVEKVECSEPTEITYGYENVSVDSVDDSVLIIQIDEETSELSFNTPNDDWFGVHVIKLYADNGGRSYSNVSITLNVTNIPDAPVLDLIPNQFPEVDIFYSYDVNATDADNDLLNYSTNSSIINIDKFTGIISFTPAAPGNYSVNISVNDSMFIDSQVVNFTISVTNPRPNITTVYPYGTPLSNTTIFMFNYTTWFPGDITSINATENTTLLFDHTSDDPEGEPLTSSWYLDGALEESNVYSSQTHWSYPIDFSQDGIRNVTLVVKDSRNGKDTFTWNVSVKNVNQNPKFGEKILAGDSDFSGGIVNRTSITLEPGNITLGKINAVSYYTNGTYVSPVIDLKGNYDRTIIESINWGEVKPVGTNVSFRVRVGNTALDILSVNWSDAYYNSVGDNTIDLGGRYMQFIVNMTTEDISVSPKVERVVINYGIRSMDITGSYQAWIDLDNFFDDKDGVDSLEYRYENIFGSGILEISISEDNIVGLYPTDGGTAMFKFIANDSESIAYSNNITLDVELQAPPETPVYVTTSGGGGGSSQRRQIVPIPEVSFLRLIHVGPLQELGNRLILAPITLKNSGEVVLNDIYLSAETDRDDITFRFERDHISLLDLNEEVKTELYIQAEGFVNASYSVTVIADIKNPDLQDTSLISINPLENITQKMNIVQDLLQLHPICRELEEVVSQAQVALRNGRILCPAQPCVFFLCSL